MNLEQKKERKKKGVNLYREGLTPNQIAERLGVLSETVVKWATDAGLTEDRAKIYAEKEKKLKSDPDFLTGHTLTLAKKYGVSVDFVRRRRRISTGKAISGFYKTTEKRVVIPTSNVHEWIVKWTRPEGIDETLAEIKPRGRRRASASWSGAQYPRPLSPDPALAVVPKPRISSFADLLASWREDRGEMV